MSIFDDAEGLLADTLGASFGRRVRLVPRADTRVVKGAPDPDREPVVVRAVLDITAVPANAVGEGTRNGSRVDAMVETILLTLERSALTEWLPRRDDEVVAIERPGQPVFRIANIVPQGSSWLVAELQRVAA